MTTPGFAPEIHFARMAPYTQAVSPRVSAQDLALHMTMKRAIAFRRFPVLDASGLIVRSADRLAVAALLEAVGSELA